LGRGALGLGFSCQWTQAEALPTIEAALAHAPDVSLPVNLHYDHRIHP
jgi:hypothetical protein